MENRRSGITMCVTEQDENDYDARCDKLNMHCRHELFSSSSLPLPRLITQMSAYSPQRRSKEDHQEGLERRGSGWRTPGVEGRTAQP